MNVYRFPSPSYARRFARNARGRGYTAKVDGRRVAVGEADAQLRLLLRAYVGLRVDGASDRGKGA